MLTPLRGGVIVTDEDLDFLAAAIEEQHQLLARYGLAPSARLNQVTAILRRAAKLQTRQHGSVRATDRDGGGRDAVLREHDLLDTAEAGRYLSISADGVRAHVRRGRLPASRAGGRILIAARDLVAFAEARQGPYPRR